MNTFLEFITNPMFSSILFILIVVLSILLKKSKNNYVTLSDECKELIQQISELKIYKDTNSQIESFSKELQRITLEKLNESREGFDKHQKESLTPLSTSIKEFKEQISRLQLEGTKQNTLLTKELENIKSLNVTLAKEANDLTAALKGNNKKIGNWGEQQLKTLLDISGLEEGIDYDLQVHIDSSIPDCVINLPNQRKVIVDAKVSLTNYSEYIGAEDSEEKNQHLKKHVDSLKRHIKELSSKEYSSKLDSSLDYVIMFIPHEQAYIDVLRTNPEFYENAYRNKIAIATPSSLLPILKTIENLWSMQKQANNAKQIATLGGQIFDKLAGVQENMEKAKKQISSAQESHEKAYNQIFSSRADSIRGLSEQMKEKGVTPLKSLEIVD